MPCNGIRSRAITTNNFARTTSDWSLGEHVVSGAGGQCHNPLTHSKIDPICIGPVCARRALKNVDNGCGWSPMESRRGSGWAVPVVRTGDSRCGQDRRCPEHQTTLPRLDGVVAGRPCSTHTGPDCVVTVMIPNGAMRLVHPAEEQYLGMHSSMTNSKRYAQKRRARMAVPSSISTGWRQKEDMVFPPHREQCTSVPYTSRRVPGQFWPRPLPRSDREPRTVCTTGLHPDFGDGDLEYRF
ncbi:hypothetical protein N657DRAFT_409587 [Parathielavia appendiculata]|uniref:Uncharacterized protein n=1 Tax=Parathielavia appendiculata TaxID=2587402 RepID=A0AAN6Z2R3_9PEZI|nr:hypothetical protein N657DRAFT_409587 [Parathielavia appendiculata]